MASFRLPEDAIAYYEGEAKGSGRDKVEIVLEALYLDRDLGRRLAHLREELERAAAEMGLNLDYDLAEVLSKLVEEAVSARRVALEGKAKK